MESILALIAVAAGVYKSRAESQEHRRAIEQFDASFKRSCPVADEIVNIAERADGLVLATSIDGRWGIAGQSGWLHRGKAKYIASRWSKITGHWPYIPF